MSITFKEVRDFLFGFMAIFILNKIRALSARGWDSRHYKHTIDIMNLS
jgi:hypothetical protein